MDLSEVYDPSNGLLFKEENALRYRKGGYHPVTLGDAFKDGRYEICHKLGYGGFSTVWVARDREREQWVSLKVITAESSSNSKELHNLQTLVNLSASSLASRHIVQLLDHFIHTGPNGLHQCLVFDLLGPTVNTTISDYHEAGERLEIQDVLKISTQLLEAATFLHEVGCAHGDLSIRNLAHSSSCLAHLSESDLFDVLGEPESEDLIRIDGGILEAGVPRQLVRSAEWIGWPHDDDDDEEDIQVIDFGEAFFNNAVPKSLPQPGGLRAPETIFTDEFDYRLDLWRIGLIMYSLIFGGFPFQYFTTDDLVESMIAFLGELPNEWQSQRKQEKTQVAGMSRLDHIIAENAHDLTLKALLQVVKGLMKFSPEDRISAQHALSVVKEQLRPMSC